MEKSELLQRTNPPQGACLWELFPSIAPVWPQGLNGDYFITLRAVKRITPSSLLSWPSTQGRSPAWSVLSQILIPTLLCVSHFLHQTPTILLPLQVFSFVTWILAKLCFSIVSFFINPFAKTWLTVQDRINIYFWGSGLRFLNFCLHFQIIFPPSLCKFPRSFAIFVFRYTVTYPFPLRQFESFDHYL